MPPPMIAGLYPYCRGGVRSEPTLTLGEIPVSLHANSTYAADLIVLAGDIQSAEHLEGFGLTVARVFDDAPPEIKRDTAHKMKHWMCRWALRNYGEFLWVDWDTVLLRPPDARFWHWCRTHGTPKFLRIPNYWATVNCGVYYCGEGWAEAMDRSFQAVVEEPNDELLWASVLPPDVTERDEFWWGRRVAQIWSREDIGSVGPGTYFAHVKELGWAQALRASAGA